MYIREYHNHIIKVYKQDNEWIYTTSGRKSNVQGGCPIKVKAIEWAREAIDR